MPLLLFTHVSFFLPMTPLNTSAESKFMTCGYLCTARQVLEAREPLRFPEVTKVEKASEFGSTSKPEKLFLSDQKDTNTT